MKMISRRRMLLATSSMVVAAAIPSRLLATDPITVLQAAAAVVSVIKGAIDLSSSPHRDPILEQIDAKLDIVIRNQERILAEILALRFYLDEAIARGFRDNTIAQLSSEKDRYDILTADRTAGADQYASLLEQVEQSTLTVGQYDIGAFVSFAAGAGLVLVLYARLNKPKLRTDKAKEKFIAILEHWLDPANEKSVVTLIAKTQAEVNSRRAGLDARPRSYNLGMVNRGNCEVYDTLRVDGNFNDGYSGSRIAVEQCHPPEPPTEPRPGHCGRICPITPEVDAMRTALAAKLAKMPIPSGMSAALSSLPQQPVPEFRSSGYAQVDDFNRERIAIFELYNVIAKQDLVREQMVAARDALKNSI